MINAVSANRLVAVCVCIHYGKIKLEKQLFDQFYGDRVRFQVSRRRVFTQKLDSLKNVYDTGVISKGPLTIYENIDLTNKGLFK